MLGLALGRAAVRRWWQRSSACAQYDRNRETVQRPDKPGIL
jgi:hypothetical protein